MFSADCHQKREDDSFEMVETSWMVEVGLGE